MDNDIEYEILDLPNYELTDTKFIRVLKTAMWVKSLNQLQLAKLLGCRQSQVSNWLNNKSQPGYHYLQMLKSKLDVHVEHFFE